MMQGDGEMTTEPVSAIWAKKLKKNYIKWKLHIEFSVYRLFPDPSTSLSQLGQYLWK